MAENNKNQFSDSVRELSKQLNVLVADKHEKGIKASALIIAVCDNEQGDGTHVNVAVVGYDGKIVEGLVQFAEQDEDTRVAFNTAANIVVRRRMKKMGINLDDILKEVTEDNKNNTNKQEN